MRRHSGAYRDARSLSRGYEATSGWDALGPHQTQGVFTRRALEFDASRLGPAGSSQRHADKRKRVTDGEQT